MKEFYRFYIWNCMMSIYLLWTSTRITFLGELIRTVGVCSVGFVFFSTDTSLFILILILLWYSIFAVKSKSILFSLESLFINLAIKRLHWWTKWRATSIFFLKCLFSIGQFRTTFFRVLAKLYMDQKTKNQSYLYEIIKMWFQRNTNIIRVWNCHIDSCTVIFASKKKRS